MKKIRLIVSIGALSFGLMIVLISLISTNQVISYEGTQASVKKLYFGETILPDHVAYPLVAAADRALLVVAPPQEKVKLQIVYSQIRMEYAQALLLKNEPFLANNALTKSQKYINLAVLHYLDLDVDDQNLRQDLIDQLQININQAQELIDQLTPHQTSMAQELNNSNQILLDGLITLQ